MLTRKTKAPQSAGNTLKGSNCAIAHTATNKANNFKANIGIFKKAG